MENDISKFQSIAAKARDYIDLINTNFVPLRPKVINQTLASEAQSYFQHNHYNPDSKGLLSARIAIAKYYNERDIRINHEKIIITASSSESYTLIFSTIKENSSEVLLPNPTYPLFEHLSLFSSLKPVYYHLNSESNWEPDIEEIKSKINSRTKFIVFISPNNPTGSIINLQLYRQLFALAEEYHLTVICDEVFCEFYHENNPQMPDINEYQTNIFILNGISKILAAADLKLAWLSFNDFVTSEITEKLELANDCYLNANYFSQEALAEILPLVPSIKNAIIPILAANRVTLSNLCKLNPQYFKCNLPAGGIHAIISVNTQIQEEELVCGLLKQKHVNTHPGYFYDYESSEPCLIVSLLQNPENFAKGISKIKEFVIQ